MVAKQRGAKELRVRVSNESESDTPPTTTTSIKGLQQQVKLEGPKDARDRKRKSTGKDLEIRLGLSNKQSKKVQYFQSSKAINADLESVDSPYAGTRSRSCRNADTDENRHQDTKTGKGKGL